MRMTAPPSSHALGYSGAMSETLHPRACRSDRNVRIDVETPLTRGKYTSEIISTCTAFPRISPQTFQGRFAGPAGQPSYLALRASHDRRAYSAMATTDCARLTQRELMALTRTRAVKRS